MTTRHARSLIEAIDSHPDVSSYTTLGCAAYCLRLENLTWRVVGLNLYADSENKRDETPTAYAQRCAIKAQMAAMHFAKRHAMPWPAPCKRSSNTARA